jgi:exopolysaccharide biosynthesis polyprenyl glycosylphosphotransferase
MISERARLMTASYIASDMATTAGAFVLAHAVRDWLGGESSWLGPVYPLDRYLPLLFMVLPVWYLAFHASGLYGQQAERTQRTEVARLVRGIGVAGLLLALVIFLGKLDYVSRPVMALFLLLNGPFVEFGRGLVRAFVLGSAPMRRVVVAGGQEEVRDLAAQVDAHREWGLEVVGVASDSQWSSGQLPYRLLGLYDELPGLVQRGEVIDEVIFAPAGGRVEGLRELEVVLLELEELGIVTRLQINFLPRSLSNVSFENFAGIPMLTFTSAPRDELLLFIRRCFDFSAALALITLLSPLLLAIAALVKITSRGPVLFRQVRAGLHGRPFVFLKFRSMRLDAEALKAALAPFNEMDGPAFKMTNDPRVTPLGRWLRKTSLDELPQLLNILRGEMSFVGPRPAVLDEVRRYEPWQRRRLSMPPGLTCLWQVSGRNELTFDEWMRLDLEYIDNWSLWLDLRIVFKTIPAVVLGRGAR